MALRATPTLHRYVCRNCSYVLHGGGVLKTLTHKRPLPALPAHQTFHPLLTDPDPVAPQPLMHPRRPVRGPTAITTGPDVGDLGQQRPVHLLTLTRRWLAQPTIKR